VLGLCGEGKGRDAVPPVEVAGSFLGDEVGRVGFEPTQREALGLQPSPALQRRRHPGKRVPPTGFEPAPFLLLEQAPLPIGRRGHRAAPGIRTRTSRRLRTSSLPVGVEPHDDRGRRHPDRRGSGIRSPDTGRGGRVTPQAVDSGAAPWPVLLSRSSCRPLGRSDLTNGASEPVPAQRI
jgi:hypothetical protein